MKLAFQMGCLTLFLALVTVAFAADPPKDKYLDAAGIPGEMLLSANDVPAKVVERFLSLAGGKDAKILVLTAGKETVSRDLKAEAKKKEINLEVRPLTASDDGSLPQLKDYTGVWIAGSDISAMRRALVGTALEKDCITLVKRKGILAASGAACGLLARHQANGKIGGCDLIPDAVISVGRNETKPPASRVSIHIDPGTALDIRGRYMGVIGEGKVTIRLPASKTLPVRTIEVQGKTLADLTSLRRALRDRAESFPPAKPPTPVVPKGTLVIIGGGGMPKGMIGKFVEMAGGKEAKIVVLPTAMPDPLPKRDGIAEAFRKAGAKKVTVLPGRTRDKVESKEYLDAMKEATGVWFGGGRQWRFIDAYENTKLTPLMFDVLNRGGVIGGSSAGATIQGEYLCRGGVFENFAVRYEGYERGLSFLPGVAIDQHFAQRKRFKDMTELMQLYPQYLGIGLDEATAIVVRASTADVVGRGQVHFYDATKKIEKGKPDHVSLADGGKYDLAERKILKIGGEQKKEKTP